MSFYIRTLRKK